MPSQRSILPVLLSVLLLELIAAFYLMFYPPTGVEGWYTRLALDLTRGEQASPNLTHIVGSAQTLSPTFLSILQVFTQIVGAGIWQGRILMLGFLLLSLLSLSVLIRDLFPPRIAVASLLLLACLHGENEIYGPLQGVLIGPFSIALCFVLAGFLLLSSALTGSSFYLLGTLLSWLIAQSILPSLSAPLILCCLFPLGICLWYRLWHGLCLFLVLVVALPVFGRLELSSTQALSLLEHYQLLALGSPQPTLGVFSLVTALYASALPAVLALAFYLVRFIQEAEVSEAEPALYRLCMQSSLLWFSIGSIFWFLAFYRSEPSLLAIALFFATPFFGAFLHELSSNFTFDNVRSHAEGTIASHAVSLATMLLLILLLGSQMKYAIRLALETQGPSPHRLIPIAASYLNIMTEPSRPLVTNQTELLFLIERPVYVTEGPGFDPGALLEKLCPVQSPVADCKPQLLLSTGANSFQVLSRISTVFSPRLEQKMCMEDTVCPYELYALAIK